MEKSGYISIPQLAGILGLSRVAVYKKVKKGRIKAVRVGRNFAIPKKYIANIIGKTLGKEDKKQIDSAIKKVIKEYGKVLTMLGSE